jgi:MOSC domain-containing protein YiiM
MSKMMTGKVEGLLLSPPNSYLPAQAVDQVDVSWEGFAGDKHSGLTMKAGSSQKHYPKGAEVRNVRQISLVSREELDQIAAGLDVPEVQAAWVGANMLVSGIPELTQLPSGSRLYFEGGVGLVVEGENLPCSTAGGAVQEQYPDREGLASQFPKKAIGKRGLVGWVEKPGAIRVGETVQVCLAQDVKS